MSEFYSVKYKLETGKFTKEQLKVGDFGGCDEVGLISVIGGVLNGESMSMVAISSTPNGPWNGDQWFEVWAMLAHQIINNELQTDLASKRIVEDAFAKVRALKISRGF